MKQEYQNYLHCKVSASNRHNNKNDNIMKVEKFLKICSVQRALDRKYVTLLWHPQMASVDKFEFQTSYGSNNINFYSNHSMVI